MADVLAVICARGGSKSLPRKNVLPLGGKPLIAWTIEAARQARRITRTIVSTDDEEIAAAARRSGAEVPFMRPAELAGDTTPGAAPVLHALEWLERHEAFRPEVVVNLQPTSPLRTASDVDAALALMRSRRADAVVSVTAAEHHPFWMKTVDADGWMHDFVEQPVRTAARQQLPQVYRLNGAIYAVLRDLFVPAGEWFPPRTAAYVMPPERSVDIDTALDFAFAEMLLEPSRG